MAWQRRSRESPDKPRFATVGPSRKSGRPRHQAREMPLPVCGENQRASSCPSPFQKVRKALVGSQEAPAREAGCARSPFLLAGRSWHGALRTASQIGLEGEGGCLRSPPPLQTSPPPCRAPDKPRFAILGPFRKSGRPRHQAREVPLPVGENQRARSCPSPFQGVRNPVASTYTQCNTN